MRITKAQAQEIIKECLLNEAISADQLQKKFPFISHDTVDLISKFAWRFASDIAREKQMGSQTDPSKTRPGNIDSNQVKEIAADTLMSAGTSLEDLVNHFIPPATQQKKLPPKPASADDRRKQQMNTQVSGDRRQPTQNNSAQIKQPPPQQESSYSEWPVPTKNKR